jgi:hypothetical protein
MIQVHDKHEPSESAIRIPASIEFRQLRLQQLCPGEFLIRVAETPVSEVVRLQTSAGDQPEVSRLQLRFWND